MSPILLQGSKIGGSDPRVITQRVNVVDPGPHEHAARWPRCQGSGGAGCVPVNGESSSSTPRLSSVAFSGRRGPVASWSGGHQYAPVLDSTQVHVPFPTAIATMHTRREDSWIVECSLALG